MAKTNNPLTIFISSTFSDLIEYREVTHAAIRKLRNHANDMINWSSDDRSADIVSVEELKHSDLVLLIVAHRYGTIIKGETRSFIELEYLTAKKHNIPVLAFFVDEDYPWPPKHIENTPVLQNKLKEFKCKVENDSIPNFFSTPESLALLVTQAIANFDKRLGIQTEIVIPKIKNEFLMVKTTNEILSVPDLNVLVGQSPDELPLVLEIKRTQDILEQLQNIAISIGRNLNDSPFDAFARILRDESHQAWCKTGLYEIGLPSGRSANCYVSYKNLSDLFSPSLLSKVISTPKGYKYTNKRKYHDYGDSVKTSLGSREGKDSRVQSIGGKNRFLGLSLSTEDSFAVGWSDNEVKYIKGVKYWRDFISESIHCYAEVSFRISIFKDGKKKWESEWDNFKHFPNTLLKLCQEYRHNTHIQYVPEFKVSLEVIARVIIQIAEQLKKIHIDGFIHGDVKPQNILLSREKPILIDSLSLKIGELPPIISPGWAAPEQIMLKPVNEASDIFPLGMMLVSLLEGQLTGEISLYGIPQVDEDRGPEMVSFFKNPFVFIEPDSKIIEFKARKHWLDFLEKCLKFSPDDRIGNAQEFIDGLNRLLSDYNLEGYRKFTIGNKSSIKFARLPNGSEKPCRTIYDRWICHRRNVEVLTDFQQEELILLEEEFLD